MECPINTSCVPLGTCSRRKDSLCSICPFRPKTSLASITDGSGKSQRQQERGRKRERRRRAVKKDKDWEGGKERWHKSKKWEKVEEGIPKIKRHQSLGTALSITHLLFLLQVPSVAVAHNYSSLQEKVNSFYLPTLSFIQSPTYCTGCCSPSLLPSLTHSLLQLGKNLLHSLS